MTIPAKCTECDQPATHLAAFDTDCGDQTPACEEHGRDYRYCMRCRGHTDGCGRHDWPRSPCFNCRCEF